MAQSTAALVNKFIKIHRKKQKSEAEIEAHKEELAKLEDEIKRRFEAAGQQSFKSKAGDLVYLHRQLWASAKEGTDAMVQALKDFPATAAFVKEGVNTQTLSGWVREQVDHYKAGLKDPLELLTPELIEEKVLPAALRGHVGVTEKISVRARKG